MASAIRTVLCLKQLLNAESYFKELSVWRERQILTLVFACVMLYTEFGLSCAWSGKIACSQHWPAEYRSFEVSDPMVRWAMSMWGARTGWSGLAASAGWITEPQLGLVIHLYAWPVYMDQISS